jgi:hypothetical protein
MTRLIAHFAGDKNYIQPRERKQLTTAFAAMLFRKKSKLFLEKIHPLSAACSYFTLLQTS